MNTQIVYREPSIMLSKMGKKLLYSERTTADMNDKQNEDSRHGWQQYHPRFHSVCLGPHGNGMSSTNKNVHRVQYPGVESRILERERCV